MMLLKKGYYVIVTYAHDKESAEAFTNEATNVSKSFDVCKIDQTDRLQTYAIIDSIKASGLKLDCIICNTGVTIRKKFQESSDSDWDTMMEVAVNSHYILIRELYSMIPHGSRIIFTGSEMALHPHGTVLAYGVTKSAVHALAQNLVKEFAGSDTTVYVVAPGFVDTEWQKKKPQEIRNSICNKTAIHRFAKVDEIAKAYEFIIDNPFVNGIILNVDGGYSYK